MCTIKHESLFCERCREPQYFCSVRRREVDLRFEESSFSGLEVMWCSIWGMDLAPGEPGFCLMTDILLCWSNSCSLGSCFQNSCLYETCNRSLHLQRVTFIWQKSAVKQAHQQPKGPGRSGCPHKQGL